MESHKIFIDTIDCSKDPLPTTNGWEVRREALREVPVFSDFLALERARQENGITLGLLRPATIDQLEIVPEKDANWTPGQLQILRQHEKQASLFTTSGQQSLRPLHKLPYSFYYHYTCTIEAGTARYKHKIIDWEAGALYWNCQRPDLKNWEARFRQKLGREVPQNDLMFLMGTIHRFPDKWLIVSLIYPPKIDKQKQYTLTY